MRVWVRSGQGDGEYSDVVILTEGLGGAGDFSGGTEGEGGEGFEAVKGALRVAGLRDAVRHEDDGLAGVEVAGDSFVGLVRGEAEWQRGRGA